MCKFYSCDSHNGMQSNYYLAKFGSYSTYPFLLLVNILHQNLATKGHGKQLYVMRHNHKSSRFLSEHSTAHFRST